MKQKVLLNFGTIRFLIKNSYISDKKYNTSKIKQVFYVKKIAIKTNERLIKVKKYNN